jgi:5-methylcytosine-specific restriction endonuclease McrA
MTVGQETHDKLRRAQELLGHVIAPGDLAAVFDRALDALIAKLEQRKFAATAHPRRSKVAKGRHIPADVRRTVRERDGDRCTFTSETGKRCEERADLEYDHIVPVAHRGPSTVENVRLCCRAHNQHHADREFGKGFMDAKRTRSDAQKTKAQNGEAARQPAPIAGPSEPAPPLGARAGEEPSTDVEPWLPRQGFTEDEVRAAAVTCEAIPDAPIHERVRYAMAFLVRPRGEPSNPAAKLTG